jgi:hypothetical protein
MTLSKDLNPCCSTVTYGTGTIHVQAVTCGPPSKPLSFNSLPRAPRHQALQRIVKLLGSVSSRGHLFVLKECNNVFLTVELRYFLGCLPVKVLCGDACAPARKKYESRSPSQTRLAYMLGKIRLCCTLKTLPSRAQNDEGIILWGIHTQNSREKVGDAHLLRRTSTHSTWP